MSILSEARKLRPIIEQAMTSVDDSTASKAVSLYPTLKQSGTLVSAGTRINWNGTIKRAAVDLWDTPENGPDNAPTLWEDIAYREGYRIIPGTITVSAAFSEGEYGWWGDVLYKSIMDNNVYTPEQYPDNWEKVK